MHDPYEALRKIQTLVRGALESESDEWLSAERLVEVQRQALNGIEAVTKKALAKAPKDCPAIAAFERAARNGWSVSQSLSEEQRAT